MKTKLLLLSVMLFTVLLSCKKDEDSATNALVGTWKEKSSSEQMIFTFNSSGGGTYQMYNANTNKTIESESFTYVFDSQANKLTMKWSGDTKIGYVKFISSTSIQIFNDAAYSNEWTFVMIKQ